MPESTTPPMLSAVLSGEITVTAELVQPLVKILNARQDCADFQLPAALKLLYGAPAMSNDARELLTNALLDFRYWLDEPGTDSMCMWSENHYILFAVGELLAGQLFPETRFSNNAMIGMQREEHGRERVERWLEWRFRFGFSEWHSPVYYEQDVAALGLLIDLCDDEPLVERARIVLDLLLLDMAIHRFNGRFVGSSGRCYEETKKFPHTAPVSDILAHAFGIGRSNPVWDRAISVFLTTKKYTVPPAIVAIAKAEGYFVCKDSSGLDISEALTLLRPTDVETTGALLWQMEAFATPATIDLTMQAYKHWSVSSNAFLAPLSKVAKVPSGKRISPLRTLLKTMNPIAAGMALQRANVYSYRTPSYHLSSVQRYHPGEFGDQQHLWQVTLPRDVVVFATHPAELAGTSHRNQTPSAWVGNAVNPDIGQELNHLVALYDTSARSGFGEGKRIHASHLYLPRSSFDESRLGPNWFVGRIGDAYLALRSLGLLEMVSTNEIVQSGEVTGYGIAVFDSLDFDSIADAQAAVKEMELKYESATLTFSTGRGSFALRYGKGLTVDGAKIDTDFPRYDNPWVHCERDSEQLEISCYGERLTLDWSAGTRTISEQS